MKKEEISKVLKKCFGKEKDDRYHAIAMLCLYGIFLTIIVVMIRIGGTNQSPEITDKTPNNSINNTSNNNTPVTTPDNNNDNQSNITSNEINYSYSYTITYNGNSEVFLGKKIDEKEKFTHIKDGITTDYAILNDNYLILENGSYHITNNPSSLFKYCNADKIISLVADEIPTENAVTIKYQVTNKRIASGYNDTLLLDNEQNNSIILNMIDNDLKSIDLDLSNYISSVKADNITLVIHMEFVDVGTTEDFNINIASN